VSILQIEVTREVERGLQREAARRGQPVEDVVAAVLEERFAPATEMSALPDEVRPLFRGLPRRSPADLLALARSQGVAPVGEFEELLGDFRPEDETCDEFIAWLRQGRQDCGRVAGR